MQTVSAQDVWRQCLSYIHHQLADPAAKIWFDETTPVALTGEVMTLKAPNNFAKEWLEHRYSRLLADGLREATGRSLRFEIVPGSKNGAAPPILKMPPEPPEPDIAEVPASNESNGKTAVTDGSLSPRYTFETFVIGPSNRFAHAAAMAVSELPAKKYNPLFIYGDSGLGKTHLLHAIGRQAKALYGDLSVKYVSTETYLNDFINAIKDDRNDAFKRRYRENDVLLIDDIQFLENKERLQEEFFHTFNALHNASRQIVISSDRPPKKIATLEDRLRSRFEWGLICDVQRPDLETRIAILRKKSEADGIHVAEDVTEYIASRVEDSVRELEGALIRTVAFASLSGTPITLPLAEEVLGHLFPSSGAEPVRVDAIMAETAAYFCVGVEDLRSQNRTRSLVHARQLAMYLVRELTDLSLPKVGEAFGGKDHTTVLHATKKVARLLSEKRNVYHQIQELTARIKRRGGKV